MTKLWQLLFTGLLVLLFSTSSFASALLISWDGSRPDIVEELLNAGRLPHLQGILATGGQPAFLTTEDAIATVTVPGHSEMLTGLPRSVTGNATNLVWKVLPPGVTLIEQWKAVGAKTGYVVGKTNIGPGPFVEAMNAADCTHVRTPTETQDDLATIAIACLQSWGASPFFLFWHSHMPDEAGHASGVTSAAYQNALVENDAALGRLLTALAGQTYQLVITTDHSFGAGFLTCPRSGKQHGFCPNMWAVSKPPLTFPNSKLLDIAPALRP